MRTDSRPAAERASKRWLRDPRLAILAALPLVLLAIESDWIFSGPHRDAWAYYGYFENAFYLLRHFPANYFSSRLAVILPGFAVHHVLPPVAANIVLHLVLYWAAVLSFYLVVKKLFGATVAFLTAFALGCHPYLLQAIGWNYVDGFGIAYFLVALLLLTLAVDSPAWRPLLAAAGALATAIVSTNLFYVVYLPVLAGHFVVLNQRHGRRIPLLAGALWASLGAISLFVLFGSLTWGLGTGFLYLRSSLSFVAGAVRTPSIFRDDTYRWLPDAVWLVFPAIVLLSGAILCGGAFFNPSLRRNRLFLWSQFQFFYLVLLMLFLHFFGRPVFQHFYYPTLLIPLAFLAFSGQVEQVMPALSTPQFVGLAATVALLQIVPPGAPLLPALSPISTLVPATALLAFAAGFGIVLIFGCKATGRRPIVLIFFCLALSQFLVRQGGSIFWDFERYNSDGRGLFRQMSQAVRAIESFDPMQNTRLWYSSTEQDGHLYDSIATAFLLCPRMINLGFPNLPNTQMCDGVQLGPGMQVAIFSADPAAFEKADAAIRGIGLSARFLGREEIAGPAPGFAITYLRTEAGAPPLTGVSSRDLQARIRK